ncbi:hypothetical protein EOD42_22270 [Rhodovarius crocodyli]|uniref:Uncharacterized protein n=1 Tax=Rhodovarius crocodyli TaxID=1979269 RepID=A0A437M1G3_9PROT|nr:hypothetical protein [Rhodovarius crocodyli]RVT91383.1 hypothetical protein EOD42_22270 [Rhodovarius crocodyli]
MKIPAFLTGRLARRLAPVLRQPEHIVSGGAYSPAMRAWRLLPQNSVINITVEEVMRQTETRTHSGLGLSIVLYGVFASGRAGGPNSTAFGPGDIMPRCRSHHCRLTPCGDAARLLTIGFGRGLPTATTASRAIARAAGRLMGARIG